MNRKFKVNNYMRDIPSYVNVDNEISLSTRLIAKHYLDEQSESHNWIERLIEIVRFFNRLQNSSYFKYKPQYKPPFTESKKSFSNTIARALAKACLDKYESIFIFDDFDTYYSTSKKKKYKYPNLDIVTKKRNKKVKGPDLLCKDNNGEFVIVECKGRLSKFNESDLNDFVKQCDNGIVLDSKGNHYKTKYFTVPCYVSFDNSESTFSIVDPPIDGISSKSEMFKIIERKHYFRVLNNLGYFELAERILSNSKQNDDSKFEIYCALSSIDNKKYVIPDFSIAHDIDFLHLWLPDFTEYIYCLDLNVFKFIKSIIQNSSDTNFDTLYSYLKQIKTDNEYLSKDGSMLIKRGEIKEINKELI